MQQKRNIIILALTTIFIMTLVLTALPQPALASSTLNQASANDCRRTYTVRNGDTARNIAASQGVKFRDLVNANKLRPPYDVQVGDQLCIPGKRGTYDSSLGSGARNTNISISISNGYILISAAGFNRNVTLMVRVREPSGAFPALQKIRIKKGTSQTIRVPLPESVKDQKTVEVCVKSMFSNDLNCYQVANKK